MIFLTILLISMRWFSFSWPLILFLKYDNIKSNILFCNEIYQICGTVEGKPFVDYDIPSKIRTRIGIGIWTKNIKSKSIFKEQVGDSFSCKYTQPRFLLFLSTIDPTLHISSNYTHAPISIVKDVIFIPCDLHLVCPSSNNLANNTLLYDSTRGLRGSDDWCRSDTTGVMP